MQERGMNKKAENSMLKKRRKVDSWQDGELQV